MLLPIRKAERIRASIAALLGMLGAGVGLALILILGIEDGTILSGLFIATLLVFVIIGTKISEKIIFMECPKCHGIIQTKETYKMRSFPWPKRTITYECGECGVVKKEVYEEIGGDID